MLEKTVKLKQSMTSPADEGNLVGLGHVRITFEEC